MTEREMQEIRYALEQLRPAYAERLRVYTNEDRIGRAIDALERLGAGETDESRIARRLGMLACGADCTFHGRADHPAQCWTLQELIDQAG